MEEIHYQGVGVDRCTNCRGLWFDGLEKDIMAKLTGSEIIDIDARIESSLIGRDVKIVRAAGRPLAKRFMVGDSSHIEV